MKGRFANKQRIGHAIDAIEEIELADFFENSMMQFACIKQLEIIGEACNHVDKQTMIENPEIEWRKVIGLRNLLIHEYFGVDKALIWDIIHYNLPTLKNQLSLLITTE
ncbi:DUF86 domain-containing protein [Spirosoma sp. KUDC1026]|uniref:HepT-like ribonuclease domain-containing protein n=1 Tax=Spirosoma sp. KUDC1026 TaxID=2745947 RepID=UPI00159BDD81|nr:HepT-like ribonuclease domain-containing protein [Spirosoma sp. KUDC1026]QKZ11510.1 DUF86 domain-containing protein [Spirosoma sp. KUDC1026]